LEVEEHCSALVIDHVEAMADTPPRALEDYPAGTVTPLEYVAHHRRQAVPLDERLADRVGDLMQVADLDFS
jgi:hypothetical protein